MTANAGWRIGSSEFARHWAASGGNPPDADAGGDVVAFMTHRIAQIDLRDPVM